MYMQSDLVQVKVVDCAGTIIINRPEHENRLTRLMVHQLSDALDDLYREKGVRAIVLTGAGDYFCAGTDLEELQEGIGLSDEQQLAAQEKWGEDAAEYRDLLVRMLETTKPIIASVNGPALSSGAGLVVASDFVISAHEATWGVPDPKFGLVAGVVAPLLCHRIGAGKAARLLLSSATIGAEEALKLGLFHEAVEAGKVWARSVELAHSLAESAPQAIQLTKRLLNETIGEDLITQLTAGAVMQATACTTEAAQEGIQAHLEKRPPEWK